MSGIFVPGTGAKAPTGEPSDATHAPGGEALAWLLVIPCGLLLAGAIALFAAPVGRTLFPPLDPSRLWAWNRYLLAPEAQEEGAYVLALVGAAGFALASAVLARVRWRPDARLTRAAWLAQLALAAAVVACAIAQHTMRYTSGDSIVRAWYFTPATWVSAFAIAAGLVLAIRSASLRPRLQAVLRERRGSHRLALGLAGALTAMVLLVCVDSDATIATHHGVASIAPYAMDEAFAIVNGLTPFVDFRPLYATLLLFVAALPLTLVAPTLLVFTLTMYALTVAALLAAFGVVRRAAGSSTAALLLFVPFLATTLFLDQAATFEDAYSAGSYYPAFPLRYAGPYLLAWLTARSLEPGRRRSQGLLFAAGGLVLLNNANFGLPALAATIAAVLCTSESLHRRAVLELGRDLVLGLLIALAALSAVTLARAGTLPDLTHPLDYSSFFLGGYAGTMIPTALGLHVIVYMTFAGALAAATVRGARRAANRVLTGMLAWTGVFGLGAGSYFVAESGPFQMRIMFSAWALTLTLLGVLVIRRRAAQPRRWPSPAEAAVLVGVGIMACSIPQLPRPWLQIERLRQASAASEAPGPLVPDLTQREFLTSTASGGRFAVRRGAPVVLLLDNGHRLAHALGVSNVDPYTDVYTLLGPAFLRRVLEQLNSAGGSTVVMPTDAEATSSLRAALARRGFRPVTADGIAADPRAPPLVVLVRGRPVEKWVDQRALSAR